ncbi:hypothetical protein BJ912DRAFT_920877 [Pholiota molesta]|nr:hypothetical protein BJ912DRAFT_920877 [Pholiota molesta]
MPLVSHERRRPAPCLPRHPRFTYAHRHRHPPSTRTADGQPTRTAASEHETRPVSATDGQRAPRMASQRARRMGSEHETRPASTNSGTEYYGRAASTTEAQPAERTAGQRARKTGNDGQVSKNFGKRGTTRATCCDHDGPDGDGDGRWGQRTYYNKLMK